MSTPEILFLVLLGSVFCGFSLAMISATAAYDRTALAARRRAGAAAQPQAGSSHHAHA